MRAEIIRNPSGAMFRYTVRFYAAGKDWPNTAAGYKTGFFSTLWGARRYARKTLKRGADRPQLTETISEEHAS